MRRLILLALLVLLCAIPAHGQSTTVSGTITDSGSQVWANGTYKLIFQPNPQYPTGPYTWTGGTLNQVISGTLDGSGHYSVSVPSNNRITPVGSTWVLQVTPNATSPSFTTANTNITGSTQTLNATPPAILIPWSLPPGPAISAYSDSEIGGTLVPGSEYFNTTSLVTRVWNGTSWANQGGGSGTITGGGTSPEQTCWTGATAIGNCVPQIAPGDSLNGIDATAAKYGLHANTQFISNATFTNGANTVSCGVGQCNFSSADNGKICFGTNLNGDISIINGVIVLPQGTLTVSGPQNATCSGGNWTGSTTSTNVFVWGTDDSSALASAWSDARQGCLPLILPSGSMLVQSGQFLQASPSDTCVIDETGGYGSYGVTGAGFASTRIIPTPNFDPTTCTGATTNDSCFFGAPGMFVSNLTIWGAGQAAIGSGFNGKVGASMTGTGANAIAVNSYWSNVGLISWGALQPTFKGLRVNGGSNATLIGVHNDGFGGIGCEFNAPAGTVQYQATITLVNVFCALNNGPSVLFSGPGAVNSFGGVYGWVQPTVANCGSGAGCNEVEIEGGGAWFSTGDSIPFPGQAGKSAIGSDSGTGGVIYFDQTVVNNQTTNGYGLGEQNGMVVYASKSTLKAASGTGNALFLCATCKYYSKGGNVIGGPTTAITVTSGGLYTSDPTDTFSGGTTAAISPSCAFTSGGGTSPSCALQAGSTNNSGTIIATTGSGSPASSGTITLTFVGTFSGPTGAAPSCNYNPNDSGTAWGNGALAKVSTQSTTAPVLAWSNSAANVLTALSTASPYRIDYTCTPK